MQRMCIYIYILVGGLEHFLFSHILGIIIPIDVHIFQRGSNHQPVYIYMRNALFLCTRNALFLCHSLFLATSLPSCSVVDILQVKSSEFLRFVIGVRVATFLEFQGNEN